VLADMRSSSFSTRPRSPGLQIIGIGFALVFVKPRVDPDRRVRRRRYQ